MNKKGFLTRDVVLTAILFSGAIALFVLMVGAISHNYNKPEMTSDSFSQNYDKLVDIADDVDISRQQSTSSAGLSFIESFESAFRAVFTVITLVFSTLNLYGDMASNTVSEFTFLDSGVVKVILTILILMLTVVIIFTWISSASRGKI